MHQKRSNVLIGRWQPNEDLLLQEMSDAGFSMKGIGALLARSYTSVRMRRTLLSYDVDIGGKRRWSPDDDALLIKLAPHMTDRALGKLLRRSVSALKDRRLRVLGIPRYVPPHWTAQEIRVLKAAYPFMHHSALSRLLPSRPSQAIKRKALDLLLRKLPPDEQRLHLVSQSLREVSGLTKQLKKEIANEERRRSARNAVRRAGSTERQAGTS